MSLQKASWALLFSASGLLAPNFTNNALAFQQTMTCNEDGIYRCKAGETALPVRWSMLELTYNIHSAGSKTIPNNPDNIIDKELENTIHQSFKTWEGPACSELSFKYEGLTDETSIGYYDGPDSNQKVNMVIWRDESWPYGSFSAVALTTVTFRPSTGIIVDADIEMNGATYQFSNTDNPEGLDVDIRNTLTHEVGHFLGLDHSNNPNATMYPTAPPLELSKRDLDKDDIDGLCHIYPLGFKSEPLKPTESAAKQKSWFCAITDLPNTQHSTPAKAPLTALATLAGIAIWTRRKTQRESKPQ